MKRKQMRDATGEFLFSISFCFYYCHVLASCIFLLQLMNVPFPCNSKAGIVQKVADIFMRLMLASMT